MNEENVQYLTSESFKKIKNDYDILKNETVPEVAKRIDEAKQQGDLAENAEYHQAKEDMSWAQGKLLELENILNHAQIIQNKKSGDEVSVGSVVTVKVEGAKREYTIVGSQEVDPGSGKISNESPLGEALLGKKAGDKVAVDVPAGKKIFEIMGIK